MPRKNEKGFTLLELVMVTAMLGILIPLTSTLILNTYNAYVEVSMINRMAASGDNSLRSVTKDITIMKKIKKADASNLYFTLIGVGERYYRFEDVNNTFQLCMNACVDAHNDAIDASFGTLSKNLDISKSGFGYYLADKKTRDETLRIGFCVDHLDHTAPGFQEALPDVPTAEGLLIGYIKVTLGFSWDDYEIPIHSIVRPALPS